MVSHQDPALLYSMVPEYWTPDAVVDSSLLIKADGTTLLDIDRWISQDKKLITRTLIVGLWLLPWALLAANTAVEARRPRLASSESPWNVLVYGGKGEMHGAPICHSLAYFSKSPLPLDFDADFIGADETDLVTHAEVTLVGAIDGQRIYEIKQTVARKDEEKDKLNTGIPPAIKILLVERRTDEFCDIYENQYAYDPKPETDETLILDVRAEKILKTYETDKRTWFLAYWAIKDHRPLRLDIDDLYTAIRSVSPAGALPFREALNLKGGHFTADIYGASPEQNVLGTVDLQLAVVGNKVIALNKAWIPTGTAHVR